jgi:hypothetical protein
MCNKIPGSHKPDPMTLEGAVVVIEPALNPHTRAATDIISSSDGSATAQINQKGIPVDPGVAHSKFANAS